MAKRDRIFALLLALIVCSVVLLSSIFIIVEANHDCTGDQCPICCQMESCVNALRALSCVSLVAAAVVLGCSFIAVLPCYTGIRQVESLVTLKVKLSN